MLSVGNYLWYKLVLLNERAWIDQEVCNVQG